MFRRVRKIAKSYYWLRHAAPSVRMQQLGSQLHGFSYNLILEDFSKICRENSSLIKIGHEQRALYIKTNTYFLSYVAHFFLE